ncbi:putative sugar nucleotidyltransferase [Aciduliprofundum sp. MAR08-339]|uniref:phosphocholine cytidylyltransferase family protein n=1 Tax=Aciduliprofundum sp. (strain MAR08-339) TaxID=673860 RepID=UPI0002A49C9C|nr:putative sugar nucleotidyltransferase [Aciduliprofundum sp. MAR08-339]
MDAIILGAGRGERLMPLTADTPKILLPLWDGETILQKQLKIFENISEIERVIVVTGYLTEKVEQKIKEWNYEGFVDIAYNPFYKVSNNLVSLWFGSLKVRGDVIVTNGDNLFKLDVIKKLIDAGNDGIFLVVDEKNGYDADDMKVKIENGFIKYVSKKIDVNETDAESTGIAKFCGTGKNKFVNTLEYLVRKEEYLSKFWLEVFNYMASKGEKIIPIWINQSEWQEMDIHSDKELIDYLLKKRRF